MNTTNDRTPTDAQIVTAIADVLPDDGAWGDDWTYRVDAALEQLGVETRDEYVDDWTVALLADGRRIVLHDECATGARRYRIEGPTGDELLAMRHDGIRIWEDQHGGLYVEPVGTGWMVAGMERSPAGAALTDARLWRDWYIADEDIHPAETGRMDLVAELRTGDEWRTYDDRMGPDARRYIHGEG